MFGGQGGPRGGPWSGVGVQSGAQGRQKWLDQFLFGAPGPPPLLFLIFLSFVWFMCLDFLIILFDLVDFSIDVHDLGDVLEARKIG